MVRSYTRLFTAALGLSVGVFWVASLVLAEGKFDPTADALAHIAKMKVKPGDWPQWGGSSLRNNTPEGKNIPDDWDTKSGRNIKWKADLGSQTYGNPVIVNGKVYVGTNNNKGYLKRYPQNVDLGCLLCFDEATGKFLWQHSSEKLSTGRVNDWEQQGICCAPYAEGERLWFVSSRGLVLCLDANGFHDGNNDGPYNKEPNSNKDEADVIWQFDMMSQVGLFQHNMCSCSCTCVGDVLLVITGNGVDEGHINIPAPQAPSFIALDRNTGKVLWTDRSPGTNILHGQWASPTFALLGGKPQALFAGGDGWLYSFDPAGENGKSKPFWKFDCNPKESKYSLNNRSDRNHLIGTPVVYDGLVYIAVGEDPEHGEGVGHLFCIDPNKSGDVSIDLVFNKADPSKPIAHKRLQACEADKGDFLRENPNSAMVWHFGAPLRGPVGDFLNDEGETKMHRTMGSVAIKNDLLVIADMSGFVHCLDAKTGKRLWGHDMLAGSWGSPLIVDGKIYISDEDGEISILELSRTKKLIREVNMNSAVYTSPVVANNTLFIANRTHLYAITSEAQAKK